MADQYLGFDVNGKLLFNAKSEHDAKLYTNIFKAISIIYLVPANGNYKTKDDVVGIFGTYWSRRDFLNDLEGTSGKLY